MSSHREAPEISQDPVADNTDVYAFVSPDLPETVTLIANYLPFEEPDGGPNFYEFGDDVLYEIHIDNNGDGAAEITYQFNFQTQVTNPNTFLYNTGPIATIDSPNWNRKQFYSVTRIEQNNTTLLATNLPSPPCNIGPRSTPNYPFLAQQATHLLPSGERIFAGQRAEGFYVDLGSIFDLLDLRPFQNLHLIPSPAAPGVNGTKQLNVHTIAIQVPINKLTRNNTYPTDPSDPNAVIGVYASASRRKAKVRNLGQAQSSANNNVESGPWMQVSRLANPLINEVIIPLGLKDLWNSLDPRFDHQFVEYYQHPEVSSLLPVLYPGVFPNLAALSAARADLVAILLTGIPAGIVPGFQNYTGNTQADLIRLNVAVPPTSNPNILGVVGGDLAGFPNGRRISDDVVTIELRALAGVTYPLIDPTFTPDAASAKVTDGVDPGNANLTYLPHFPYLGIPYDGFDHPANS